MPRSPKKKNQPVSTNFPELHDILMDAPIRIFTSTPDGRYISVNPGLARMYGYNSPEEMIESVPDIATQMCSNPDDREEFMRLMQEQGKVVEHECQFRRKDGTKFWASINAHAVQDEHGLIIYYQGFTTDITKRKWAEEALHEEATRRKILVDQSRDGIVVLNEDGSIHEANKRFAKMLGYTSEEIQQLHIWDWDTQWTRDQLIEMIRQVDKKGELFETSHQRKDGISFVVEISTNGAVIGGQKLVFCICRDVTERKQAEEDIRTINKQLQKVNAEKDKLFSIIAHDLKSPMAGVCATSKILAQEAEVLSRKDISIISAEMHKSTENALDLLNDLMQWARMSQGGMDFSPEECSLDELARSSLYTAQDVAKKKGITISCNVPKDIEVLADQPMINAVIRNIIFNSVKFTNPDGNISVTARKAGSNAEVCVQDDGIGMDEAIISKIFSIDKSKSQYGTNGEKGTGLGLILCKEFVEKHGGKIWVESEPGKGTKVFFTLPTAT